jgi:hypothetical protein
LLKSIASRQTSIRGPAETPALSFDEHRSLVTPIAEVLRSFSFIARSKNKADGTWDLPERLPPPAVVGAGNA